MIISGGKKVKKVLCVLFTLVVVLSLATCGGSTKAKGSGSQKTLTVWYWGEQEAPGYKAFMEEIVKRYEAKNPGVKVDAVLQESDTLASAFRTAEEAKAGPDVQFLWGGVFTLEEVWLDHLVPISDYISKEDLSDVFPSALAETYWDGKQWGFPSYQLTFGVAYNKKMFAGAGIDPENPFRTWAEFINCCAKLKAAGYTPLGFGLKDGWLPGWLSFYLSQDNIDSINEFIACFTGKARYSDPKYSEWLGRVKELSDRGFVNNDIQSLDFYQGQQLLESEDAAITFHTNGYAATLEKSMGADTIGFTLPPINGKGKLANTVVACGQSYTIPKSAKDKKEAAKFILFLKEEDNLKLLYNEAHALFPSTKFKQEWLDSEIDRKSFKWNSTLKNFICQYFYPPMFEYEGIVPVVQKMFSENLSPALAAKELDETITKWAEQDPNQAAAFTKWVVPD